MRILSLTNCILDERLGSGKTAIRWTRGLRERGHEVDLFCPTDFTLYPSFKKAGRLRQALGARGFLRERLASKHYDLVEFYGGEFGWAVRALHQAKKRPVIVAHTNGLELLAKEQEKLYEPEPTGLKAYTAKIYRHLDWSAFECADYLVTICQADIDYALEQKLFKPDEVAVVSPGIDPEYLKAPCKTEREHRVAFIGSWIGRKDTKSLVAVMTRLLQEDLRLAFDIFGTSQEQDKIHEEFPFELRPRVFVYPSLSRQGMQQQLAKAKVFFFPSLYEGFGMAIAEAMACGCAVVSTRTGFGADLKDGEDALTCDFQDVEGMSQAIKKLLDNEALREKIARAGYDKVQKLTWSAQVDKLEQLYKNWMNLQQNQK
tara:strand:+ start:207 stop:1325 length:1119 start_codon:yes stop_codon:yes gene_type:complete